MHVMTMTDGRPVTTERGDSGLLFIGPDDRGVELEVLVAKVTPIGKEELLLVIHVMPTALRKQP